MLKIICKNYDINKVISIAVTLIDPIAEEGKGRVMFSSVSTYTCFHPIKLLVILQFIIYILQLN